MWRPDSLSSPFFVSVSPRHGASRYASWLEAIRPSWFSPSGRRKWNGTAPRGHVRRTSPTAPRCGLAGESLPCRLAQRGSTLLRRATMCQKEGVAPSSNGESKRKRPAESAGRRRNVLACTRKERGAAGFRTWPVMAHGIGMADKSVRGTEAWQTEMFAPRGWRTGASAPPRASGV